MSKHEMSQTVLSSEFKSGLTWRSILSIIYSVVVFTPVVIWLQLVTVGAPGLGGVISYFMLMLFAEYCRLSGKPLTLQEATIIFGPASIAGATFINLVYRAYFMQSPLVREFGIDVNEIPPWWAPPPNINLLELRTFMLPEWIPPLLVFFIAHYTSWTGNLFFGLLARELFIESERLPFPMATVRVVAIETLARRDERKISVFTLAAFISLIYGILLYTLPTITAQMKKPIKTLPIPWFDFTKDLERICPGMAFGVATDIMILASGFVLPEGVIIGMLIGSILRFIIINPLLLHLGLTDWAKQWVPGMDLTKIYQESTLYFWINPIIGMGFAVGIVPILLRGREFIQVFRRLFQFKTASSRMKRFSGFPPNLWLLLALFMMGCVGAIILDLWLVPDFPIWALIFYEIILPFVTMLMSGRIIGLTGQNIELPYMKQLIIIASGHPRIDAWFLPLSVNPGIGWLRSFKLCELTKTTVNSMILTNFIAWPFGVLMGFLFTQIFWWIAPIPSVLFPAPAIQWPIRIMHQCIWITRPVHLFHLDMIVGSFIILGGFIVLFNLINIPINIVGVVTGLSSPIPVPTTIFIGYIIRKVLGQVMGKKWVQSNRAVIASGLMLGEGIAIIFGVMGALLILSLWTKPF